MRTPQHDRPLDPASLAPAGGDGPSAGQDNCAPAMRAPKPTRKSRDGDGGADGPERRCILSAAHGARAALIRLALSPDGELVPDVASRAPGRGAWIGVERPALEIAMAKGKMKGALARAFKGAAVHMPADLPQRIADALERQFLAQIGLASKAGALLTGAEKVDVAARSGQVALLCHAADAADDGRRKRDQSWRVGQDAEGSGMQGRMLPIDRVALSVALGRDNAVHIAIVDSGWGARLSALLDRWQHYAGWGRGDALTAPAPEETTAQRMCDGGNAAV
ncbi:MAG: DUF448 domain-containing protein [Sphingopyxis sp.]